MILTYDRTDEPTLLERPSRKQPEPMRQCDRVPPAPPKSVPIVQSDLFYSFVYAPPCQYLCDTIYS